MQGANRSVFHTSAHQPLDTKPGNTMVGTHINRMSVAPDGRIVLPDGMSYRVLVLPEIDRMTVPVLRQIREWVAAGAKVVGPKPAQPPGLAEYRLRASVRSWVAFAPRSTYGFTQAKLAASSMLPLPLYRAKSG